MPEFTHKVKALDEILALTAQVDKQENRAGVPVYLFNRRTPFRYTKSRSRRLESPAIRYNFRPPIVIITALWPIYAKQEGLTRKLCRD